MLRAVDEVEFHEQMPYLKAKRWAKEYKGLYEQITFDTASCMLDFIPVAGKSKRFQTHVSNASAVILGATLKSTDK